MSAAPLAGEHIVITRASSQSAPLADAFRQAGASITLWPLIEIVPPDDRGPLREAAANHSRFDWIVFTSANAVQGFFAECEARQLGGKIASVGPATSAALQELGVPVALEATLNTGAGLAAALGAVVSAESRVLVPRADDARPELVVGLQATGAAIETVVAYRKRLPPESVVVAAEMLTGEVGWITFTSPRIVRAFRSLASQVGSRSLRFEAVSIGPTTSSELRRFAIEPVEALAPTLDGMVAAVARSLNRPPPGTSQEST